MVALICAMINIATIARCFIRKTSLFHPVCLVNLMWLAVHMMNVFLGWNSGEFVYIFLALPSLFFSIGFISAEEKKVFSRRGKYLAPSAAFLMYEKLYGKVKDLFQKVIVRLGIKPAAFKKNTNGEVCLRGLHPKISTGLLAFVAIIFTLYAYEFLSRLNQYDHGNIWYTFRVITWDYGVNDMFVYKYSSIVSFLLPSILLVSAQKSKKWSEFCKFLISLVIAVIWSILRTSRTSTFSVVIIMVMSQILLLENNDAGKLSPKELASIRKKKIGIFAAAVGFILAIFLYVALQKETNTYGDVSIFEFFLKSLANYTNLSSAAFVEWYKQGFIPTNGVNSFRFIVAVLYKLGIISTVPASNAGGLFITFEGLRTNALTVARAYVEDFGVAYMALIMMIFGVIHGAVYKKACSSTGLTKIRFALINAMLDIPLFFQILTNQYMNVLSGWLQYVFWICLFTSSVLWITSSRKVRRTVRNKNKGTHK